MSMGRKQGEVVTLEAAGDLSGGQYFTLYDTNNHVRTLQPYERLVIDSLVSLIATTDNTQYLSIMDNGVVPNVALMYLNAPGSNWDTTGEGMSVSAGTLPLVQGSPGTTGISSSVAGTGRILTAGTRGKQAGYQALLTPGGKVSGNG